MEVKMGKGWWKSKTLWINALTLLGALSVNLAEWLSADQALTTMAIVNIILRVVTKESLGK